MADDEFVHVKLRTIAEHGFEERARVLPYGPCFGQHGLLTHIGDKIQCHICGRAFHCLPSHIVRRHGVSASEYKAAFGLHRTLGLVSDALHHKKSNHPGAAGIRPRIYEPVDAYQVRCDHCGAPVVTRKNPKRPEAPKTCGKPECVMARKTRNLKGWVAGVPLPQATRDNVARTKAARRQLVTIPCVVCRAEFQVQPYYQNRITCCSKECRASRRRDLLQSKREANPSAWQGKFKSDVDGTTLLKLVSDGLGTRSIAKALGVKRDVAIHRLKRLGFKPNGRRRGDNPT